MCRILARCHRTVMEAQSRLPRPSYLNVFIFCVISSCLIMVGIYARVRIFISPLSLVKTDSPEQFSSQSPRSAGLSTLPSSLPLGKSSQRDAKIAESPKKNKLGSNTRPILNHTNKTLHIAATKANGNKGQIPPSNNKSKTTRKLNTADPHKNMTQDGRKKQKDEESPTKSFKFHPQLSSLQIVTPGENIQAGNLEVHITTAVHYENFPAQNGFNVFLNGWAKHKTDTDFKCCLVRTLPNGSLEDDVFVEARAFTYHIYDQWIVDMQNAEFSCSLSKEQLQAVGSNNFSYVTFAKDSCYEAPSLVMEIVRPKPMPNSLGLCLKITYGSLDPEKVVEWFEYVRIMGVTKVFTYYFDLDPPVFKLLEYYKSIGYLELMLIHPAKSKDGADRGYRKPRWNEQAWVDEVMAANDCKHRMAGFDYVIVMDMDEFIVPKGEAKSYYDILRKTSTKDPMAGCFPFNSHVVMPEWGATRASPLHLTRFTERTVSPNYDGADRNTRWGFQPNATFWMQNNLCHPRKPFWITKIDPSLYTLLHYRSCKPYWKGCKTKQRVNDTKVASYEKVLVDRILNLPVKEILYNNMDYVNTLISWKNNN